MAAVFVMGVFWKRCTTLAANIILTFGTIFSIGCGILYLWVIPNATHHIHFMMLSFLIFTVLIISMVAISYTDRTVTERRPMAVIKNRMSLSVQMAWIMLAIVMIRLYVFFNGH